MPLNSALPVIFVIQTQLFNDFTISNIFTPSLTLFGIIVCLVPKNTYFRPANIRRILKIITAIQVRLG